MQLQKQAQSDILNSLLDIDEKIIRFVGIVDCNANTLMSKSQKTLDNIVF